MVSCCTCPDSALQLVHMLLTSYLLAVISKNRVCLLFIIVLYSCQVNNTCSYCILVCKSDRYSFLLQLQSQLLYTSCDSFQPCIVWRWLYTIDLHQGSGSQPICWLVNGKQSKQPLLLYVSIGSSYISAVCLFCIIRYNHPYQSKTLLFLYSFGSSCCVS
jgi:hypothetical protein